MKKIILTIMVLSLLLGSIACSNDVMDDGIDGTDMENKDLEDTIDIGDIIICETCGSVIGGGVDELLQDSEEPNTEDVVEGTTNTTAEEDVLTTEEEIKEELLSKSRTPSSDFTYIGGGWGDVRKPSKQVTDNMRYIDQGVTIESYEGTETRIALPDYNGNRDRIISLVKGVFGQGSGVEGVRFGYETLETGDYVFEDNTNLRVALLGGTSYAGVIHIGEGAFKGCTSLRMVEFGRALRSIDVSAFEGCTSLTEIHIPRNGYYTVTIGDNAFAGCDNLEVVTLPESVKHIGDNVFTSDKLTIRGYRYSYAEQYAEDNGYTFERIDSE